MEDQVKEMPNSISPGGQMEMVELKQLTIPSFGLVTLLLVLFVVLKVFIYVPDEKRQGK